MEIPATSSAKSTGKMAENDRISIFHDRNVKMTIFWPILGENQKIITIIITNENWRNLNSDHCPSARWVVGGWDPSQGSGGWSDPLPVNKRFPGSKCQIFCGTEKQTQKILFIQQKWCFCTLFFFGQTYTKKIIFSGTKHQASHLALEDFWGGRSALWASNQLFYLFLFIFLICVRSKIQKVKNIC